MLGGRKYLVSVVMDGLKDARTVSAMEGYGAVNEAMRDHFYEESVTLIIPTKRTYLGAVLRMLQYSKRNIYTCIVPA